MASLFSSGRVVDAVLALMLIELFVLVLVRGRAGAMFRPLELMANFGAGAALLLALRFALRGSQWPPVALCLLLALCFHVWDLWSRRATRRAG
jgi:hypothetical protein